MITTNIILLIEELYVPSYMYYSMDLQFCCSCCHWAWFADGLLGCPSRSSIQNVFDLFVLINLECLSFLCSILCTVFLGLLCPYCRLTGNKSLKKWPLLLSLFLLTSTHLIQTLPACNSEVRAWMSDSKLKLHDDEQVVRFSTCSQIAFYSSQRAVLVSLTRYITRGSFFTVIDRSAKRHK